MKSRASLGLLLPVLWLAGCQTPPPEPVPAPAPAKAPSPAQSNRPAPPRPAASTPAPAPAPSTGAATASTPPTTGTVPAPAAPDTRLSDGIAAYERGEYPNAIRRLSAKELLENPSQDVQIEARKYLAFSYCVTTRRALCQQQFDAILKLRPGFELKPTEAGHPTWGPVFKKAKAAAAKALPKH